MDTCPMPAFLNTVDPDPDRPRATIRMLVPLLALMLLVGCSAQIDTAAVVGQIENYRHADGLQRSIRISWWCGTKSVFSNLFSPSGETGCNNDHGRGEVKLPISPEGTFEIPAFDVKVTKFFSSPSLYFKWELVTVNKYAKEDAELLIGGTVYDNRFFQDVVAEYRSLRHIAIEDACVDADITAIDGPKQFPFDDIRQLYPDSYNFTRIYDLSVTLRRDGQVVTSPHFAMVYGESQFCGTDFGLFVPAGEQGTREELSYSARVEIAAGVVYSTSPPDPVTGQRSHDYRHVREVIVRKGVSSVELDNRIPDNLLQPITLALDITQPATN